MFNAYQYFQQICEKNKILVDGEYRFCRVTGLANMEEVIQKWKAAKAWFCIDDTEDGTLIGSRGAGFFERRSHTVFILKKFPYGNMDLQHAALQECRTVFRQIMKKLILDRRVLENEMTYLKLDSVPWHEFPGYVLSGCTGLYFEVVIEIPIDLCYNGDEWNN
ncbi:MAG: hypothetical protein LBF79_05650 [Dysgonamonadaceae bacterium]|jgi:hypothetical protein|nr:hypothetical protein [Dysgonamonadaceae bacterium]